MSVINQMLKDLQERAPDSGSNVAVPVAAMQNKSGQFKLVAIVIFILLCNGVGLYVWFLFDENKTLKAETVALLNKDNRVKDNTFTDNTFTDNTVKDKAASDTIYKHNKENITEEETAQVQLKNEKLVSDHTDRNNNTSVDKIKNAGTLPLSDSANLSADTSLNESQSKELNTELNTQLKTQRNNNSNQGSSSLNKETLVKATYKEKPAVLVKPAKKPTQLSGTNFEANSNVEKNTNSLAKPAQKPVQLSVTSFAENNNVEDNASALVKPIQKTAKMSVTSRQVTSTELVEQKLEQAENAISANNIAKAEQLFEEVLIIEPSQAKARKTLAALWFGRQAWQEAINLISQGIAMDPENSDLRLMQAKIYIKKSNFSMAYQTLIPLTLIENIEYQIQLANTAQKIGRYSAAITAYKLLIKMQPESARWYLGLAIVYDQNSQFLLATSQYELALKQGYLSLDSKNFAQQRIQALGE